MTTADRQNVILIVFDTARRDRFGCYGYRRGTTPAVDAFARDAVVFDRMIAPAPWTVPSHASLFTGLYPREHGAHNPMPVLGRRSTTMAAWLAAANYATVCVTNNPLVHRETGLSEGFGDVVLRPGRTRKYRWLTGAQFVLGYRDSGAAATNRVIADLLPGLRRPFFLFINFLECHWAYMPPRRFERRFAAHLPWTASIRRRLRQRNEVMWEAVATADSDTLTLFNDLYDAELACLDDRFGRLLETLERARVLENSVVMLTSDHGENIGDAGLASHQGSLRQNLIHVPFLARIPGRSPQRTAGLTQFTDLFAGLCGQLGVAVPAHLQDRPFSVDPFAMGPHDHGRTFAFAEWQHWGPDKLARVQRRAPHFDFKRIPNGLEAVQTVRYKLVEEMGTGRQRLHDLAADPNERLDIFHARPREAAMLQQALERWRAAHPRADGVAYSDVDQAAVEHRLQELGYL